MIKRAITSMCLSAVWAAESYHEKLTIVPLPQNFNVLHYDFNWQLDAPTKHGGSFNLETFPE